MLSLLQLSAGPVPFTSLLDLLAQRVTELRAERDADMASDTGSRQRDRRSVGGGLSPGPARLGTRRPRRCRRPDPCTDAEAGPAPGQHGAAVLRQGSAVLTPLGNWAVWVKLEQICVAAQSPAGNIEQPAADMLRGCARLTPGPARAEYRAWLAARSVGSAVTELLAAARGEDALLRGLAFEALRVVGAPAEPDVRAAAEEPSLRPYALLWLAELRGSRPRGRARPGRAHPGGGDLALGGHRRGRRRPRRDSACSSTTWSPPYRARSPRCSTRCVPSATPAPCRCWSRWPPHTPTRPSPRPYAGRLSRCTPAAAEREAAGRAWARSRTAGKTRCEAPLDCAMAIPSRISAVRQPPHPVRTPATHAWSSP